MDHIRQDLDELMGKDRNHPLHVRLQKRDHFDDDYVCKYNLLSFCPHDLFPNTKADIGPCQKRHDDYLKEMFKNDPDREIYQRKYEKELQSLLEQMIAQVDQKMKRSIARVENPGPDHINQPEINASQQESLNQKIDQLEQKINFYIERAEKLGEEGQIDESEAIMKVVDDLKKQKTELESLTDVNMIPKDKNMKVCPVCGALQASTDTDRDFKCIRKQKREEYRRLNERQGKRRSRSRSVSPTKVALPRRNIHGHNPQADDKVNEAFYFSSKKYGSGVNVPDSNIRFTELAIENNKGVNVQLAKTETMAKEWGYYKRAIDKKRREQQNKEKAEKRDEERGGGYKRFDDGGRGGRDGGDRRNDRENFSRPPGGGYGGGDRNRDGGRQDDRRGGGQYNGGGRDNYRSGGFAGDQRRR
eukprot:403352205